MQSKTLCTHGFNFVRCEDFAERPVCKYPTDLYLATLPISVRAISFVSLIPPHFPPVFFLFCLFENWPVLHLLHYSKQWFMRMGEALILLNGRQSDSGNI